MKNIFNARWIAHDDFVFRQIININEVLLFVMR